MYKNAHLTVARRRRWWASVLTASCIWWAYYSINGLVCTIRGRGFSCTRGSIYPDLGGGGGSTQRALCQRCHRFDSKRVELCYLRVDSLAALVSPSCVTNSDTLVLKGLICHFKWQILPFNTKVYRFIPRGLCLSLGVCHPQIKSRRETAPRNEDNSECVMKSGSQTNSKLHFSQARYQSRYSD